VFSEQRGLDARVEVGHEFFVPESQRLGVVGADVLDRFGDQSVFRAFAGRVEQLGDVGEVASGKDVAADEVVRVGVGFVSLRAGSVDIPSTNMIVHVHSLGW